MFVIIVAVDAEARIFISFIYHFEQNGFMFDRAANTMPTMFANCHPEWVEIVSVETTAKMCDSERKKKKNETGISNRYKVPTSSPMRVKNFLWTAINNNEMQ